MQLSETAVRALKLPVHIAALASASFVPLTHCTVLEMVDAALDRAGLAIAHNDDLTLARRFTTVDDNAKMYATMRLTNRIDPSAALMIGVANSWNKTMSLRIGFGSHVFVCTNGCFFAEKVVGRKHTTMILQDLPALID